jgi:hypothetical protein
VLGVHTWVREFARLVQIQLNGFHTFSPWLKRNTSVTGSVPLDRELRRTGLLFDVLFADGVPVLGDGAADTPSQTVPTPAWEPGTGSEDVQLGELMKGPR